MYHGPGITDMNMFDMYITEDMVCSSSRLSTFPGARNCRFCDARETGEVDAGSGRVMGFTLRPKIDISHMSSGKAKTESGS